MAAFRFRARDREGRLVAGEALGETAAAVASQLIATGITPVRIDSAEAGAADARPLFERIQRGVSLADLMLFCRQMQALMKAGIPLVRALRGLAESARNPALAAALREVVEDLNGGRDLASALARQPDAFPPLFVNMVRVGESSGRLDEALMRLYRYVSFERETRERIKAVLRYPMIVLTAVSAAVGIVIGWVVPQFARIYGSFHAQLPVPTRVIIAISHAAVSGWPVLVALIAASAFALRGWLRTESGRLRWDRLKLRLPIIGGIIQRATLARFARGFAMTVRSGVPMLEGIGLVSRAVDNEYVGARIRELRDGVERGEALSRAAAAADLFTPLVLQMLAVGEETGRLDEMMEEVADFYDREVQADVEGLGAALEPLLILVLGAVVLVLALGVFLPMWNLAGAALGHH